MKLSNNVLYIIVHSCKMWRNISGKWRNFRGNKKLRIDSIHKQLGGWLFLTLNKTFLIGVHSLEIRTDHACPWSRSGLDKFKIKLIQPFGALPWPSLSAAPVSDVRTEQDEEHQGSPQGIAALCFGKSSWTLDNCRVSCCAAFWGFPHFK